MNNQMGSSRKVSIYRSVTISSWYHQHILASVNDSLARLMLDYIDVLQLHRFDDSTPIEETMRALHDVVTSGKVRYVGMSSCFAYQFQLMQRKRFCSFNCSVLICQNTPSIMAWLLSSRCRISTTPYTEKRKERWCPLFSISESVVYHGDLCPEEVSLPYI